MAWTKVQDTRFPAGTSTAPGTAPAYSTGGTGANPTLGNLAVVLHFMNSAAGADTFTISDTQGLTWTQFIPPHFNTNTQQTLTAWFSVFTASTADTLTLGWTNADPNGGDIILTEWSGLTGTPATEGTTNTFDSSVNGTDLSGASLTPAVSGDLMFEMFSVASTVSAIGTGWTPGDFGGVAMVATGDGWGWATGTTSPLPSAGTQASSGAFAAIVGGIQAGGGGPPADLNVYRIN